MTELDETFIACHEIRFTQDFHHRAEFPVGMNVGMHAALLGFAVGFLAALAIPFSRKYCAAF